jgi:hypothetical protein
MSAAVVEACCTNMNGREHDFDTHSHLIYRDLTLIVALKVPERLVKGNCLELQTWTTGSAYRDIADE